jgi:hypothetical protein
MRANLNSLTALISECVNFIFCNIFLILHVLANFHQTIKKDFTFKQTFYYDNNIILFKLDITILQLNEKDETFCKNAVLGLCVGIEPCSSALDLCVLSCAPPNLT